MNDFRHAALWNRVIRECGADAHGIHGPRHWARVERNGLYLARGANVNPDVISMFALFHDACRVNDGHDPGHGERGAAFARDLRPALDFLDDAALAQLIFACTWHTDLVHHDDPAIQICFDADRLDLGRVGIQPAPRYLNTAEARRLAGGRLIGELEELPVRHPGG